MAKLPPKVDRRKTDEDIPPQVAAGIEKMSGAAQTAIVICARAFRFGGNWGYIPKDVQDFKGQIQTLLEDKRNIHVYQVANGALVEAKEAFLGENVNLAVPNAINGSFVEMAKKRRADEQVKYQKFIKSVAEGKSRHLKNKNGYYEITIGIYSVNDTNVIRLNGQDYPAYKLSLIEALEMARLLEQKGLEVYAKAVTQDNKVVFDRVFALASNSKGKTALFKGLEISDSETGVFLTLRIKPTGK